MCCLGKYSVNVFEFGSELFTGQLPGRNEISGQQHRVYGEQ